MRTQGRWQPPNNYGEVGKRERGNIFVQLRCIPVAIHLTTIPETIMVVLRQLDLFVDKAYSKLMLTKSGRDF